jgi:hypothetical protein
MKRIEVECKIEMSIVVENLPLPHRDGIQKKLPRRAVEKAHRCRDGIIKIFQFSRLWLI